MNSSTNAGDDALALLNDDAPVENQTPPPTPPPAPTPQLDGPPALARLDAATAGLLMPSESDEPFRTVYWPLEERAITPSEVALYLTENAQAEVETRSVSAFFANASTIEDWMSDTEKADARRFEELSRTLETELDQPRVYLIGEREKTAAIIGRMSGGFGGVVTRVIET